MKDQNWSTDLVAKPTILKMVVYIAVIKLSDFIPLFMEKSIINVKNVEELTIRN